MKEQSLHKVKPFNLIKHLLTLVLKIFQVSKLLGEYVLLPRGMKIADMEFCEVEKDPTSNIKWKILRKRENKFLSLKILLEPFLGKKKFEAAHKLK